MSLRHAPRARLALSYAPLCALLCALTLPAQASGNLFLKLTGIEGDVTARGFEKQIQVESYGIGIQSLTAYASSGLATQAGLPTATTLNLAKRLDKSSVSLFKACATNSIIDTAVLSLARTDRDRMQVFFRITLKNVRIASLQQASDSGLPMEQLVLTFSRMTIEDLLDPTTNQVFTWDVSRSKMMEDGVSAPTETKPDANVNPDEAPIKQKKPLRSSVKNPDASGARVGGEAELQAGQASQAVGERAAPGEAEQIKTKRSPAPESQLK